MVVVAFARVAPLLKQRVRIFTGEASFEIVEVGTQFGAQFLRFLELAAHRFDARVERLDLLGDGVANLLQRFGGIAMPAVDGFQRTLQHFGYAMQRKTQRTQTQNATEALQVLLVIQPVTAFAAGGRDEAALLVILQRTWRDAEAFSGVAYGEQGGRVL